MFPEEPLPAGHRVRGLKGFIRSAHRAGALDIAFKRMGDMVLEDMALHRQWPAADALQTGGAGDRGTDAVEGGDAELRVIFAQRPDAVAQGKNGGRKQGDPAR